MPGKPVELVWLFNEIGMLTSKLTDLLVQLNDMIERAETTNAWSNDTVQDQTPKVQES